MEVSVSDPKDDRRKLERLAQLALMVLDAQRAYFGNRTKGNLNFSLGLETRLRKEANAILAPLEQQALIMEGSGEN
jgi:hypothetical protein